MRLNVRFLPWKEWHAATVPSTCCLTLQALVTPDEPAAPPVKKDLPDPSAKMKGKSAEPKEKTETVKEATVDETPDNFNVQALWPLGVVAAGGALFALAKVDSGFADLFDNAVKVRHTTLLQMYRPGVRDSKHQYVAAVPDARVTCILAQCRCM